MVMAQNLSMEAAIGTLLRLKRASGWRVPLAKSGPIGATVFCCHSRPSLYRTHHVLLTNMWPLLVGLLWLPLGFLPTIFSLLCVLLEPPRPVLGEVSGEGVPLDCVPHPGSLFTEPLPTHVSGFSCCFLSFTSHQEYKNSLLSSFLLFVVLPLLMLVFHPAVFTLRKLAGSRLRSRPGSLQ